MTLDEEIDFFFAPPLPPQTAGVQSPLHLVRRELQDCLTGTVVPEHLFLADRGDRHRLFATVMVIMSGIDLLAKFYAGSDASGQVGVRFTRFAGAFIFKGYLAPEEYADVLYYGCRNPVTHSFNVRQQKYKIFIADGPRDVAVLRARNEPGCFVVCVEGLALAFIAAVREYETLVRNDTSARYAFSTMFFNYGSIGVQSIVVDGYKP